MIHDQTVEELSRKLDLIARLLAYELVADSTLTHGVPVLKRLGMNASEIAAVFDTTAATVRARLTESRKAKKKRKNK